MAAIAHSGALERQKETRLLLQDSVHSQQLRIRGMRHGSSGQEEWAKRCSNQLSWVNALGGCKRALPDG